MAYGDLKVRNLIWNTGSGDNTIVTSTLATSGANTFTGHQSRGDNLQVQFGAGNDLTIYSDGTNGIIHGQSSDLYIKGNSIYLQSNTNEASGYFKYNGAVELYYDGVKKLQTTANGVWTNGNHYFNDNQKIELGDSGDLQIYHHNTNWIKAISGDLINQTPAGNWWYVKTDAGNDNSIIAKNNGAVELYYDGSKKLETTSSGVTMSGWIYIPDSNGSNNMMRFGNGADLKIYHDGNNSRIEDTGTGRLFISSDLTQFLNAAKDETTAEFIENGACQIYYDNSKKFETTSTGVQVTGRIDILGTGTRIDIADNGKIILGDSNDFQIFHDGSNRIRSVNSTCFIEGDPSYYIGIRPQIGENSAKFLPNGAVELYYDDSKKLETVSAGVKITGTNGINPTLNLLSSNADVEGTSIRFGRTDNGNIRYHSLMQKNSGSAASNYLDFKLHNGGSGGSYTEQISVLKLHGNGHVYIPDATSRLLVGTSTVTPNGGDAHIQAKVAGASLGAWLSDTGTSSTRLHMRFTNPQGVIGSISTNSSSTSFNTTSDYRLKENEVAISDGITRLKTLKPYRFNFKTDSSITVDGFFAHEVTPAVPEAITGEKDGTEMQAIDQSKLVPLLTAALQEAITKIETLETKVAALEA